MSITRIRIRKRENPYVQIDKTILNDKRISFRAKGLHAYLLSKPDSWVVHISQLEKESPREGRDAIASALKELEIAEYITRHKIRNDRGQLIGWETEVFETPYLASSLDTSESTPRTDNPVSVPPPRTDKPKSAEPKSAEPKSAEPPLVIKDSSENVVAVKKEKEKKNARAREPFSNGSHARESSNGHRPEEPPPTPEQQDEAIGAVKGLIDQFLGRHEIPHAEAEISAAAKNKADQLARAKARGLI
jgi:hypothetical protein